ncbi:MBL fold metallo-hydrolase [Pontibacter sp. SGAir0037]|uniref:MBL fold metallo-hydrolase n=1 Tax=Pontibacter sp. SGAir0037 TaxID=2571030 RepID=UPI0010CD22C9|nr:MBL fold metallo-hydrolase [Pontibacter sp. SGAir0037]QCR22697.1 Zn-dependent hydrolase [Pontibacter sp. SGAir0037]
MKRRRFLSSITVGGLAVAVPSFLFAYDKATSYTPVANSYTHNPQLKNLLSDYNWPGTPLDQKGLFMNHEFPFWPRFGDVLKWQTERNFYKATKKTDSSRLAVVKQQSLQKIGDNTIVWLGHACFLIHLNGLKILIDPVLDSPSFTMKRYSELPLEKSQLIGLDYILISHDHRDHCDESSIKLLAKQNPEATWLCGLQLDTLIRKWTASEKVQAAGWYQQYKTDEEKVKISFLPTRHWARRGLSDTNTTLWGAFMLEAGGKKIYFGGDSGYGSHVKQVREVFGQVDYYIAGIGAFAPRWFMGPSHMHPEEAAQACEDLKPAYLLPMHFGTFDLSDEPLMEPERLIRQLKADGAFASELLLPAVGEVLQL